MKEKNKKKRSVPVNYVPVYFFACIMYYLRWFIILLSNNFLAVCLVLRAQLYLLLILAPIHRLGIVFSSNTQATRIFLYSSSLLVVMDIIHMSSYILDQKRYNFVILVFVNRGFIIYPLVFLSIIFLLAFFIERTNCKIVELN